MRSLLPVLASAALLALTAAPAQAQIWTNNVNLPVPGRMTDVPYNPARFCYNPVYWAHLHNHYPKASFSATPQGEPSAPPAPPFCVQQYNVLPLNIPRAPDLMNPGPYGALPWYPPFQGMLLPPPRPNCPPGTPVMGGGGMALGGQAGPSGVFGVHPFARSPRDFFMVGD